MWKTEFPWTGCSYEKGTLKEICDYLESIAPTFVRPLPVVSTRTIFTDHSQRKSHYADLNLDDNNDAEYNHGYEL